MNKAYQDSIRDVVVIGGGPAGMMAALCAGARSRSVLLLEKNPTLGKKLLITGGGRCNVTNNQPTIHSLAAKYKPGGKFLFSALAQFGVADTLEFFNRRGVATKEENDGRMFPVSNSARSIWQVLTSGMSENGVAVETNSPVQGVAYNEKQKIFFITLKNGKTVPARSCIISTGGLSRPETGSTGEGFRWLQKLGHTIHNQNVALVPIALKDAWAKKVAGLTLKGIKITIYQAKEKISSKKGNILFTHVGLSGPLILNASKEIGELLEYERVTLAIDLFPALDFSVLKQQLQTLLIDNSNRKLKNTLNQLIPAALVSPLLALVQIDGDTPNHSVRHEDRLALVHLFKGVPVEVKSLLGKDKAVISSGGVELSEVNFKTMESTRIPRLFIIGDMLNIDRPSGGYSLQLCWTTGYVAGNRV